MLRLLAVLTMSMLIVPLFITLGMHLPRSCHQLAPLQQTDRERARAELEIIADYLHQLRDEGGYHRRIGTVPGDDGQGHPVELEYRTDFNGDVETDSLMVRCPHWKMVVWKVIYIKR